MKWPRNFKTSTFCFVSAALVLSWSIAPAYTQQDWIYSGGVIEDWTHHHVVFSNPGSLEDAIRNGRRSAWERIVNDPRYRMQQIKRTSAWDEEKSITSEFRVSRRPVTRRMPIIGPPGPREPRIPTRNPLHADWHWSLGTGNHGIAVDMFPAKYTFAPVGSPDCVNDFVVFPINADASGTQADLLGLTNLYEGACSGSVPNILFAYDIGTGDVKTSPVLSLDGTKVAFVESISGGSYFHVVTIDKSGNSGCPSASPCNGDTYNTPAVPGINNSAVDTKILMSGGVGVTGSSPFVDYSRDIAYVGDDSGQLHKFTGVFLGTPAEVTTSPWPFSVAAGVILTGPVFDGGASQNIFVGGSDGNLYCVTFAGAACSTPSVSVASGIGPGPVEDEPIVDSTAQTVFAAASNSTNSVLMQVTTSMGSPVRVTMGVDGTDLYAGAFDNAYFTSIGTGHMYFCGNRTTAATPTLWRVTFNANGTMSSTNDGDSFQLVANGFAGRGEDCTPLTEVYNASQNEDYLFLGVTNNGFTSGTPDCANDTCIMSFVLPTSAPFTFPTAANATGTNATLSLGSAGISGIIIDNVSGPAGASQIYFGNLEQSTAVQASQSALQ